MSRRHHIALPDGYTLHWYTIESVLGQGGFGITYLARDNNLAQQVAIKEYLPTQLATRSADSTVHPMTEDDTESYQWGLERFVSEAQTLAKFRHPSIVRVLSVFEANNSAYMVMEYEAGEGLHHALRDGRIGSEAALLSLLMPLLDGLEQIHASGFIHRDIKPDNIYLRQDGTPVLLDFGSARRAVGAQTQTLTALVTPGYAPFEQYDGSGSSDDRQGPWTDIYSLGATLYRAVCGTAPPDALARANAVLSGKDSFVPAASSSANLACNEVFLRAVDNALAFKPEDRPQSVQDWRRMFTVTGTAAKTGPGPASPPERQASSTAEAQPTDFASEAVTLAGAGSAAAAVPTTAPSRTGRLTVTVLAILALGISAGAGYLALSELTPPTSSGNPVEIASETGVSREQDLADVPPPQATAVPSTPAVVSETASPRTIEPAPAPAASPAVVAAPTPGNTTEALPTPAAPPAPLPARATVQPVIVESASSADEPAVAKPTPAVVPLTPESDAPAVAAASPPSHAEPPAAADANPLPKAKPATTPVVPHASRVPSTIIDEATINAEGNSARSTQRASANTAASAESAEAVLAAERVEQLLVKAEQAFAALRLTSPADDNAVGHYREAQRLAPGDGRAAAGLQKVIARYVSLADSNMRRSRYQRAADFLRRADSVVPDDETVASKRAELEALQADVGETRQQRTQQQTPATGGGARAQPVAPSDSANTKGAEQLEDERRTAAALAALNDEIKREQAARAQEQIPVPLNIVLGPVAGSDTGGRSQSSQIASIARSVLNSDKGYDLARDLSFGNQLDWSGFFGGMSDPAVLRNAGRGAGADAVLVFWFNYGGTASYDIDAYLVSVASGKVYSVASEQQSNADSHLRVRRITLQVIDQFRRSEK